eukprot:6191440-Pleurochrysis_carterae.AAC.1
MSHRVKVCHLPCVGQQTAPCSPNQRSSTCPAASLRPAEKAPNVPSIAMALTMYAQSFGLAR